MKNIILKMCIVACSAMFSSCSNDESYTENANKYQAENSASVLRPGTPNEVNVTGNIEGIYTPAIEAQVMATNSKGIHYYGVVYDTGEFFIQSIPVDIYTVTVMPKSSPFQPISVANVLVRAGQTSNVGLLSFYVMEQ